MKLGKAGLSWKKALFVKEQTTKVQFMLFSNIFWNHQKTKRFFKIIMKSEVPLMFS